MRMCKASGVICCQLFYLYQNYVMLIYNVNWYLLLCYFNMLFDSYNHSFVAQLVLLFTALYSSSYYPIAANGSEVARIQRQ